MPADPPKLLSIGELSERSGVPTTTLRYYDELGLVPPAARVAGRRVMPRRRSGTSA